MKLILHDYAGHPFQAQLSRSLASRGHDVHHFYCSSNSSSPKGALVRRFDDPPSLSFEGIPMKKEINKTSFLERRRLEVEYGRLLASRAKSIHPDVIISANSPLDTLNALNRTCRAERIPWVFWMQDRIGLASVAILQKRIPFIGWPIGNVYHQLEIKLMRQAAFLIGIADEFGVASKAAGVPLDRYKTIPNWAPLDEIFPRPKRNSWSEAFNIADRFVFLYSGTLGFKHNPNLFIQLAMRLKAHPKAVVVINSEGQVADWLRTKAADEALSNIIINPFQRYDSMSDVLGSADVLVSILEPDAGAFSIPSKVLSYHCAGRPSLLAVPATNLASRIVQAEGTGVVVDPQNTKAFVDAAVKLMLDDGTRAEMSARARIYAEKTFDIKTITSQFEFIATKASVSGNVV